MHGGALLAGIHRRARDRGRYRLRVPLSRRQPAGRRVGDLRLAVRRNRRHAGGATLRQIQGPENSFAGQRAGKLDRAGIGRGAADQRRARGRRRVDQGLHHAVDRAGLPDRGAGPRSGRDRRQGRGRPGRGLDRSAGAGGGSAEARRGAQGARSVDRRGARRSLSWTRHQLPHCLGRRAEAQGNFLHPRRRL